jgi:hypothetical protein
MHKLVIAAAAIAFAAPAFAQLPPPKVPYQDPLEDRITRSIPSPGEIEAMAPALDRSMNVLMNMDIGPLMDAVDPLRRSPDYGRPGRTLGAMGGRDDPYFEERMRSSVYGATANMGRMMGAFAAAAPALARSMRELERAMSDAMGGFDSGYADPYPPLPDYDD